MRYFIVASFAAMLLWAAPARAYDMTGVWRSSLFGSTIVAELSQKDNLMSGVVTVYGPFGGANIYHVQGAVFENGHIYALHGSGHVFEGDFSGPDAFGGVLTLAGGRTFTLQVERDQTSIKADGAQGANASEKTPEGTSDVQGTEQPTNPTGPTGPSVSPAPADSSGATGAAGSKGSVGPGSANTVADKAA